MRPIPIPAILSLIQSGYPADIVFRITVDSVGGLRNSYSGGRRQQPGDPEFHEVITILRELQADGGLGMRMKATSGGEAVVIFLRQLEDDAMAARVNRIRALLRLDEAAREFTVVYGSHPENNAEIAILSRSIMQILVDSASHFDVPETDVTEGRVYRVQRTPEEDRMFPRLLAVRCGSSAPADAHVSVPYRDQWFWIDDDDVDSKQMLNFLMLMFSLTETGSPQTAPVLTVPTR